VQIRQHRENNANLDNVEHRTALAAAEVVDAVPTARSNAPEGRHMPQRKIHLWEEAVVRGSVLQSKGPCHRPTNHVDKVAHTRAVRRVVLVTVHAEELTLADSDLPAREGKKKKKKKEEDKGGVAAAAAWW
jgi:hypothetical protein